MRFSAGIDMGGTFTKLALVDFEGNVIQHEKVPSLTGSSPIVVINQVRLSLEQMCSRAHLPYPPPDGCGIGVPGVVDYDSGTLKFGGAFGWSGIPLRDVAEESLGCRTAIDTDVNAGLLADLYFGNAAKASEMLYISWGTGVGAGLTVQRKVYHSSNGAMGNLGHTLVVPDSPRRCFCGINGCLEVEIGGRALVQKAQIEIAGGRRTLISTEDDLTPERIAQAARAGDALALEILREAVTLLAHTLSASLSLLNPDTVIFAGGVSRCLPIVRDVFDRELARSTPSFTLAGTTIQHSAFGESAGVIGAATLATLRRRE